MALVYLCNVPFLDNSYNNVVDFESIGSQQSYFRNAAIKTFELNTKNDSEKIIISVPFNIGSLSLVNYLFLQDDNGKYVYYFVNSKERKTDNNTLLNLQLDTWTTYYFDWAYLDCFIERCHAPRWRANGMPVINTVPENLEYGDHTEIEKKRIYTFNRSIIYTTSSPIGVTNYEKNSTGTGGGDTGGDTPEGTLSAKGFRFIKGEEGFAPNPFKLQGEDFFTVSYGITEKYNKVYFDKCAPYPTPEEKSAKLSYELISNDYTKQFKKLIDEKSIHLQQNQFDCLTSLQMNGGYYGFLASNLWKEIQKGPNTQTVYDLILKYKISYDGHIYRRQRELKMYRDNIYEPKKIQIVPTNKYLDGDGWLPSGGNTSGLLEVDNDFGTGFLVPCHGSVTSLYGYRKDPITGADKLHGGIDIGAPEGTPFAASKDGVVKYAGWQDPNNHNAGFGIYVMVQTGDIQIFYPHLTKLNCSVGDTVKKGSIIGYCGSTGHSTGPHLHWEIRKNGQKTNPAPNLKVGEKV